MELDQQKESGESIQCVFHVVVFPLIGSRMVYIGEVLSKSNPLFMSNLALSSPSAKFGSLSSTVMTGDGSVGSVQSAERMARKLKQPVFLVH